MSSDYFDRHQQTLEKAVNAIHQRDYFSAFPEIPSGKIYGETAKEDGQKAFDSHLNGTFDLDLPGASGTIGEEISPFGLSLNISYPRVELNDLLPAARAAMKQWGRATPEQRIGVCLEILHRVNKRSFEIALAVMHTTGQGYMMAFQAGGPHAQDRGLEAVAYAWEAMHDVPRRVKWTKQVTRDETITLDKTFHIVPKGVAAVVACSTFPTWNSYPGLFASLATGNSVIVKPHPGAVLPLAITVQVAREVLQEAGFDPNVVTLLVDSLQQPVTKELVTSPDVHIVDYTGSSEFGNWIESNATQAAVFTEKGGVNTAIIDQVDDLKSVTGNLAFSLSLYSGQMCTTPQNIFIPRDGIIVGGQHMSFDDVAAAVVKAVDWFLGDAKRGAEVLGAIQNPKTAERVEEAAGEAGTVLRQSSPVENEQFPEARVRSPLIMQVDAADESAYMREMFGPISYIVATDDTEQSIELAARCGREKGSITSVVYSTDQDVLTRAEQALIEAGVPLSCNLTGHVFVNQAAAFSDYHVSGANPAGNATFCDMAFVSPRFRVVQSRIPVTAAEPVGV